MPSKELISGEWKKVCSKADCQYKCKKCVKAQKAEYNAQPEIKARKKAYDAEYNAQPEIKARTKVYNAEHYARPEIKARKNQRLRDRYNSDSVYRVKCNVSSSIYQALKANGWTKGGSTFDYLPYSPEELMEHLEKQFDEHMTRDNYGTYWHIDHIKPHVMSNYDSLDHPDFQKCWALENLRPLKASENMSKGSFWEGKRHYHNEAA